MAFTEGLSEVMEIVAGCGIENTPCPATYIRERIGRVRDYDTAILVVRIDRGARLPRFRFRADDPSMARYVRPQFVAWMANNVVGDVAAAELIGGELIGNVVRHAPGAIDVAVDCEGEAVRLYVQDTGGPLPPLDRSAHGALAESGRGLLIVAALGSELHCDALPRFGKQISVALPVRPRDAGNGLVRFLPTTA